MSSKDYVPLLYLLAILVGFYLLFVRPQRSRARKTMQMQSELHAGDRVMLTSGIFGSVVALRDDQIDVTVADGVVITVDRRAVGVIVGGERPSDARRDDARRDDARPDDARPDDARRDDARRDDARPDDARPDHTDREDG